MLTRIILLFGSVLLLTSQAHANYRQDFKDFPNGCNALERPYDYRATDARSRQHIKLVESAHFTAGVRRGEYGNTGRLEGDLDYVLRHIPNHAPALLVAARNQMKPSYNSRKSGRKDYHYPSKECYFRRALDFAPQDAAIHLVIAIFYHQFKSYQMALKYYQSALALDESNAEVHYNLGLLYFTLKDYENAQKHSQISQDLGYPLKRLAEKLKKVTVQID